MSVLDEITALFRAQIGVRETPVNNVIYNTDYYGGPVNGADYPWCCAFIWDVFRMAGHSDLFCGGEKTAYCPYVMWWAKAHNRWVTKGYLPGDLLLFDWDHDGNPDHIGFVVDWFGTSGHTIEGNADDAVALMQRFDQQVIGAYRPLYPSDTPAPIPPKTPDNPLIYTVKAGDSLWAIAERFLGAGQRYSELMAQNGLKSSQIYVGQVLRLPGADNRKTFSITVSPETQAYLNEQADLSHISIGEVVDRLVKERT
jgi:LysM repeat protein